MNNPCNACLQTGISKNKKTPVVCCYEDCEQAMLVHWLDIYGCGIKFSALAQSTWTNYKGIAKNQRAGVRPGVPDMMIALPAKITKCKKTLLCFVEMKKLIGSNTSEDQEEWNALINEVDGNVGAKIIKGGIAAIKYIELLVIKKIEPDETPAEREISLDKKLTKAQKPFKLKCNNAKDVPVINYNSKIKVEDLPF